MSAGRIVFDNDKILIFETLSVPNITLGQGVTNVDPSQVFDVLGTSLPYGVTLSANNLAQAATNIATGDYVKTVGNNTITFNVQSNGRLRVLLNGTSQTSTANPSSSNNRAGMFLFCEDPSHNIGVWCYTALTLNSAVIPVINPAPGEFGSCRTEGLAMSGSALKVFNITDIAEIIIPNADPYTPGDEGDIDGPSGPGGGEGDHDTTSDPINIPSLPTTSAVNTGFITLFNPSLSEIRALADYMWNGLFDINNLRKLFADPMDVILGLSIVPGPVPSGTQEAVSIGNISTGVMMTKAADQFFTVDCGTLKPTEFWGAYLDYSPYTKVDIYLPFIGMRSLSIDDVMEKNVNVVYHVDILSGACVAFIKSGDQVLYTHIGQCASSIPINGNDWTNTINGILSMATAIAGTVATGGAAAPMLAQQAASVTNILKPSVARSGGMGGMGGMLGIQKPYLILTRPRQCVPGNQNIYKGYPAFMTRALGDLSGMTSVEDIHLAVAGATQEELEEIERLLKEGVLL